MSGRVQVLERYEMAKRLGGLYHAEAAGLLRALYAAEAAPEIYTGRDHREAYLRGFHEGRTILEVEAGALTQTVAQG